MNDSGYFNPALSITSGRIEMLHLVSQVLHIKLYFHLHEIKCSVLPPTHIPQLQRVDEYLIHNQEI